MKTNTPKKSNPAAVKGDQLQNICAGAFLISYLFAATCIRLPLFFLESCLGQLTSGDVIKVWKLIPLFKGKIKFLLTVTFN